MDGPELMKSRRWTQLLLLLPLACGTMGCTPLRFLLSYHKKLGLQAYLVQETGKKSVAACGIFTVGPILDRQLTEEQRGAVATCINSARAREQAFFFAVQGYGGNGITFSFLAAQLIGDLIAGSTSQLLGDFALDRDGSSAS